MLVRASELEAERGEGTRGLVLCVLDSFPFLSDCLQVGWKGVQTALCALLRLLHTLQMRVCTSALEVERGQYTRGLVRCVFILSRYFSKCLQVGWEVTQTAQTFLRVSKHFVYYVKLVIKFKPLTHVDA